MYTTIYPAAPITADIHEPWVGSYHIIYLLPYYVPTRHDYSFPNSAFHFLIQHFLIHRAFSSARRRQGSDI
jgi:hypothetical protein